MTASYAVNILDNTGQIAGMLTTRVISTLRYERKLNDVSTAQFTIPADDDQASLISKHTWFEVHRYPDPATDQLEGTFITVLLDQFEDEAGRSWLIVSGVSLEYLLLVRILDPRNDPLAAGGWSTKQDPVDTIMAEIVNQQAGAGASAQGYTPSQQAPYLSIDTPAGTGETIPFRRAWDGLLEILQDLAKGDRMDFRIDRTSGIAMTFYAEVIGSDKSKTTNYPGNPYVLLTPELGVISQPRLVRDWRDERTVIYLLGKGAGENREFYGSMATNVYETPYSYAAIVEDLREAESAVEYIEQAQQSLAANSAKTTFSFEVRRASQNYRIAWNLGDFVTVGWGDFLDDMRVIGVQVEVSADGETIKPEFRGRYE